jgi:hypothetical protein
MGMNIYYSIRLEIPHPWEKRALYRVNCKHVGGVVERWLPRERRWNRSIVCQNERDIMRLGGVHATPAQARALQCYSRRMLKK